MNKEKLIPELRFPEFVNDGEWEEKNIDCLGRITTGKTPSTKNKNLWNGDVLFITPTDISKENKYQLNTTRTILKTKDTKILPIGSIVYTCIASIGKIALTTKISATNQQINSITVNENNINEFIYYALIKITPYIKSIPATSTLPIINKTKFSQLCIQLPTKKSEQQKIADCLSSLDDLIENHNQKLDALKEHKKGLMQNLFPQDGEKVPSLRFPEFVNDGEWEEKNIDCLGRITTGKTPSTKNKNLWNGDVLFITPTDISKENKYQLNTTRTILKTKDTKILPIGSIVYTCIASIGKIALTTKISATNQQINSITVNENNINEFIYYALIKITPYIKSIPATSTLPIINKTKFSQLCIQLPTKKSEQQKIADCLSSLDDLITAQSEKIEQLQLHKKGLMQGLFPNNEG